jgi:hypothetical protein
VVQSTDTGRKAVALVAMFRDLSACNCIKCRYGGKRKSLSLGTYPDVPFTRAQSGHRAARRLLAAGVDPSAGRRQLRGIEGDKPEVGCETSGNWLHAAQVV